MFNRVQTFLLIGSLLTGRLGVPTLIFFAISRTKGERLLRVEHKMIFLLS